jgi:hypothetical protein
VGPTILHIISQAVIPARIKYGMSQTRKKDEEEKIDDALFRGEDHVNLFCLVIFRYLPVF